MVRCSNGESDRRLLFTRVVCPSKLRMVASKACGTRLNPCWAAVYRTILASQMSWRSLRFGGSRVSEFERRRPELESGPERRGEVRENRQGDDGLNAALRGATLLAMKTHHQIDQRSLALARAVVEAIDQDPARAGLERARSTCRRWTLQSPSPAVAEWSRILEREWEAIRLLLLDPGEEGCRLRQSSPFCGVLSPRARWEIYRRIAHEHQAA